MKFIKSIICSLILFSVAGLYAQQEGVITNFKYFMTTYNPAFAGVHGESWVASSFRQQWSGIEDAPSSQVIALATPLTGKLNLGISVYNSNTFVESQTFTGIDFSYRVQLAPTAALYFGLKAGGNFYSVNTSGLSTYNMVADPDLTSISNFNPNIGAGVLLQSGFWQFSLAVPRILTTDRANEEDGMVTTAAARPHLYASAGYEFLLNPASHLSLQPSALLRYVSGAPVSVDFNAMLSFDSDFSIGASYRTDTAVAGLVNLRIKKRFLIGYAYEVSTRNELASARNTNEFSLQFLF